MKLKTITLGDLKAKLEWMRDLPDDTEITFGNGDLTFSRAKPRLYRPDNDTPAIINIEFGELYEITHDFGALDAAIALHPRAVGGEDGENVTVRHHVDAGDAAGTVVVVAGVVLIQINARARHTPGKVRSTHLRGLAGFGGGLDALAGEVVGQLAHLAVTRVTFSVLDAQAGVVSDAGFSGHAAQITFMGCEL